MKASTYWKNRRVTTKPQRPTIRSRLPQRPRTRPQVDANQRRAVCRTCEHYAPSPESCGLVALEVQVRRTNARGCEAEAARKAASHDPIKWFQVLLRGGAPPRDARCKLR